MSSYVEYSVAGTWTKSVLVYSFVYCGLQFGRFLGRFFQSESPASKYQWPLLVISMAYMGMALGNRTSIMILSSILLGDERIMTPLLYLQDSFTVNYYHLRTRWSVYEYT
jgi:hypothetical protein